MNPGPPATAAGLAGPADTLPAVSAPAASPTQEVSVPLASVNVTVDPTSLTTASPAASVNAVARDVNLEPSAPTGDLAPPPAGPSAAKPSRRRWIAALAVALALGGGVAAWQLLSPGAGETDTVTDPVVTPPPAKRRPPRVRSPKDAGSTAPTDELDASSNAGDDDAGGAAPAPPDASPATSDDVPTAPGIGPDLGADAGPSPSGAGPESPSPGAAPAAAPAAGAGASPALGGAPAGASPP